MSFVDDVDGRLQRWLERQNEVELKDAVNGIYQNEEKSGDVKLLDLYNLLFCESKKQIAEYIDIWGDADIRSKKIVEYIIEQRNIDILNGLLKFHFQLYSPTEWYKLISPLENSDLEFGLAKLCGDAKDEEVAIRLFNRIVLRADNPEAVQYYNREYRGSMFFPEYNRDELMSIVEDWSKYNTLNPVTEAEKAVVLFIEGCYKIICEQRNYCYTAKAELCEKLFPSDKLNNLDILSDEKRHLRALVFFCYGHPCYPSCNDYVFHREKKFVSKTYALYNKMSMFSTPKACINSIRMIIEHLLLKRFSK